MCKRNRGIEYWDKTEKLPSGNMYSVMFSEKVTCRQLRNGLLFNSVTISQNLIKKLIRLQKHYKINIRRLRGNSYMDSVIVKVRKVRRRFV